MEGKLRKIDIPMDIVLFFLNALGVDVTSIPVYIGELEEGTLGTFDILRNIVIVNSITDKKTIVHEITHYCQFNYNISFSIKCKTIRELDRIENIKAEEELDEAPPDMLEALELFLYYNSSVEIDARIAEGLWEHFDTGSVSKETLKHIFQCGASERMMAAIKNVEDENVKDILINVFDKIRKIEGREGGDWE